MTSTIAELIHRVARGKHGHEHLNIHEARKVFAALLKPDTDELQLGAFLIAQRMKGETAPELAGFVQAAREKTGYYGELHAPAGSVDLPCYAGKKRAAHVHLLAAIRASQSGIPVVVHGLSDIAGRISAWQILQHAGVRRAQNLRDAEKIIKSEGIVYIDIASICPDLFRLLILRPRLGVRSCASTVARLLNPLNASGQLNGFFHTPYAELMAEANATLEQPRSLIFMGAEGEPELYADRQKILLAQEGQHIQTLSYPPANTEIYPRDSVSDLASLSTQFKRIYSGDLDHREQATFERMMEAFSYAHGGNQPFSIAATRV